jgi:hypothetical protein
VPYKIIVVVSGMEQRRRREEGCIHSTWYSNKTVLHGRHGKGRQHPATDIQNQADHNAWYSVIEYTMLSSASGGKVAAFAAAAVSARRKGGSCGGVSR